MSVLDIIAEWFNSHFFGNPETVDINSIESGLRGSVPTTNSIEYSEGSSASITDKQRITAPCQYWLNGLYPPCVNWDHENLRCLAEPDEDGIYPTGYGIGRCDMLGRRDWCSHYVPTTEINLNERVCIAPCVEKSGLAKIQVNEETGLLSYNSLLPSEITGYNADDSGVGRCDGWGLGRGGQRESYEYLEDLYKDIPICNYYRPNQMGFGALQPRPFHGSGAPGKPFDSSVNWLPKTLKELYDGSPADPSELMAIRLPFNFDVYNSRAMYQKCGYWDDVNPGRFSVDTVGSDPSNFKITVSSEALTKCKCQESGCLPFKTISETLPDGASIVLQDVWAEYGGVVCNGAKPECPYYTGKWLYCTEEKMRSGMYITADQLFELRFWTSNWADEDEYERYYLAKPGRTDVLYGAADISTADIYTFTHWANIDVLNPNDSQMVGKKHSMCVPAPPHKREFIPAYYISKEDYKYPRLREFTGTGEVMFPTLIRALEDPLDFVPDILVLFPYFCDDPWNVEPCDDAKKELYCHNTNLMEDCYSSVIGYSVPGKNMYVINSDLSPVFSSSVVKLYMDEYTRFNSIPFKYKDFFNEKVKETIEDCIFENIGIFKSSAFSNGAFIMDAQLNINNINNLYVICEYDSGKYVYRKVSLFCKYWGALIEQNSAIQDPLGDGVYTDYFPAMFNPKLTVTGKVNTTNGFVQDIFSAYSFHTYSIDEEEHSYYSYCINEYTEEEVIEQWTQIGCSGYIFAEINNINISYLWDFTIVTATIESKVNTESDVAEIIELEILYPEVDNTAQRRKVPPSVVIFKPKESNVIRAFFNSDWILTVEYSYQRLEDSKFNPVWPSNLDSDLGSNHFVSPPSSISFEADEDSNSVPFTINNVGSLVSSRGPLKIMALVCDDRFVTQAVAATKLVLQGQRLSCRSVEIYYRYAVDALKYRLEPHNSFFTHISEPSFVDNTKHIRTPECGDHECNSDACIGPMWFPFNRCSTMYYRVYLPTSSCTLRISEGGSTIQSMGNGGWRYCKADDYKASIGLGGNWAALCGTQFTYYYSEAKPDTMKFTGYANRKAKVDSFMYSLRDWALPPFGNSGREYVERFLIRDFVNFYDFSVSPPETASEYMPMVFDKEDLFQDLNAFNKPFDTTVPNDPFFCFPLLSCYLGSFINEYISEDRYRFDEIINVLYHGNCMYPYPLYGDGPRHSTVRYGFKHDNIVWAWPEYWKDIERPNRVLDFIILIKPEYYFDYYKKEYRLITDEGEHTITFEPPSPPSAVGGNSDSESSIYPSLRLDNGEKRFFKIVYDDYNSTELVEWMDESSIGGEGASGGPVTIYEEANNGSTSNGTGGGNDPQWMHNFNTLFDETAESEPSDDRKVLISIDNYGIEHYAYYNMGVIVNIQRDRLKYLPMDVAAGKAPDSFSNAETIVTASWSIEEFGKAPVTLNISGVWGAKKEDKENDTDPVVLNILSKPTINITELIDGETYTHSFSGKSGTAVVIDHDGDYVNENFVINLELDRYPHRFVGLSNIFEITLIPQIGETLSITSVSVDIGKYVTTTEKVSVWERKYYAGLSDDIPTLGSNADGPNTHIYRQRNLDNRISGQYFPASRSLDEFSNGGKIISKLNMVGCSKVHINDEPIDININNIKKVELEEQKGLYDLAYDLDNFDTLIYNGMIPPVLSGWLEKIGASDTSILKPGTLTLTTRKIPWDNNEIANRLNQSGEFFTPGGHYFDWAAKLTQTRCFILGEVENVYMAGFFHNRHGGSPSLQVGILDVFKENVWRYKKQTEGYHF